MNRAGNPSAMRARAPILALSIAGLLISSYLALYQWGVFGSVWEPFFGDGSRAVLHSSLAKRLPIPDAALGAGGYLLESVFDVVGGTDRWRTKPWIVALFGLCAGSLGAVSVLLVILQPTAFGHWCTLCLASAAISITIAFLAFDEVRAMVRHLQIAFRQGRSPWQALVGQSTWPHHLRLRHQKGGSR
jgi:uncharacterized membrane protein